KRLRLPNHHLIKAFCINENTRGHIYTFMKQTRPTMVSIPNKVPTLIMRHLYVACAQRNEEHERLHTNSGKTRARAYFSFTLTSSNMEIRIVRTDSKPSTIWINQSSRRRKRLIRWKT